MIVAEQKLPLHFQGRLDGHNGLNAFRLQHEKVRKKRRKVPNASGPYQRDHVAKHFPEEVSLL